MTKITLIGVDPGLIDTGVAWVTLDPVRKQWSVGWEALSSEEGPVPIAVQNIVMDMDPHAHIWVERWRERGSVFGTHGDMRILEQELRAALPKATFLENMGVKKLVSNRLLAMFDLLNVQATNHQDIQAAARIMLLGAIKDEELNLAVYLYVTDALDGKPWKRITEGESK